MRPKSVPKASQKRPKSVPARRKVARVISGSQKKLGRRTSFKDVDEGQSIAADDPCGILAGSLRHDSQGDYFGTCEAACLSSR